MDKSNITQQLNDERIVFANFQIEHKTIFEVEYERIDGRTLKRMNGISFI